MEQGPARMIRSNETAGYENLGPLYEWKEGKAYLIVDKVVYEGKTGAVMCYSNPPVHQVGNPALDAFLEGLKNVMEDKGEIKYFVLYSPCDPVHAGGDLKESLNKLDSTLELKKEKEAAGASPEEIDSLFDWADNRLKKGFALHGAVRDVARQMRVVAVCGGGTRFGGSVEIPLMADFLVGDSRSGMCLSEAMIGLIPGWSGVARALIKAGQLNAEYMAKTCSLLKSEQLKEIGIYNMVVPISTPFPKKEKTEDPERDKAEYVEALAAHEVETGRVLLPKALEVATCAERDIPVVSEKDRALLAERETISEEIGRRVDPENYSHLWGKPLKEVKEEIGRLGRPLAPQSIEALNRLFEGYHPETFDEKAFVEEEMREDAALYRDRRLREGLKATLDQVVADFR